MFAPSDTEDAGTFGSLALHLDGGPRRLLWAPVVCQAQWRRPGVSEWHDEEPVVVEQVLHIPKQAARCYSDSRWPKNTWKDVILGMEAALLHSLCQ